DKFFGQIVRNGQITDLNASGQSQFSSTNKASRSIRELVRLTISTTHITLSLPEIGLTYIDQDVTVPFTSGVLQLAHHDYDPKKAGCDSPAGQQAAGGCSEPDTWHWSDIAISKAQHFDIDHPVSRFAWPAAPSNTFTQPAGAGQYLRFTMTGSAK